MPVFLLLNGTGETTHPREGTETELQDQDSIIHARNNSSP